MKIFKYLKYYFEPNDKMVRHLAFEAARKYYRTPVRNAKNPFPRVIEYNIRREGFLRYQRAFNHSYRHFYAMQKLYS